MLEHLSQQIFIRGGNHGDSHARKSSRDLSGAPVKQVMPRRTRASPASVAQSGLASKGRSDVVKHFNCAITVITTSDDLPAEEARRLA